MKELLRVFIRYLSMTVFGVLVSKGYLDESLVEPLIGTMVALFAIIWYWRTKAKDDMDKDKKLA